jgi:type IX secretion system PorP/SprF family membrane protein
MKTTPALILLFIFLLIKSIAYCQDIHFSQFFAAPVFTNPANTGNFEGDYRFVLNNKNQWNSFTNAYTTFAGSMDAGFSNLLIEGSRSGVGVEINNDIAGDSKFGTSQFYLNLAYYYPIDNLKKINIGLGLKLGYVRHGINFNNLTFGNQYDGEQYNPTLPTGEAWSYDNFGYPDFGVGMNLTYNVNPKLLIESGIAAAHLTQPVRTFYSNSESFLPIKYSIIASAEYNIKDDLWVEPHFLALFQQKYSEYNLGGLFRFDYNPIGLQSLYFGGLLRTKDAGIVVFGFKYHNVRIGINYDINLSKLSTVSRGKGGAEFSLIYIFLKPRPYESPYYRKCPDFI